MRYTIFLFLFIGILLNIEPAHGQVVDTKIGKVEFIGLEQWEVSELVDTLRAISPRQSIHACAADLRLKLGFIDASAIGYYDKNHDIYTVITVIGPQYKEQIKYLNAPSDSLESLEKWEKAIEIYQKEIQTFYKAVRFYSEVLTHSKEKARDKLPEWVNEKAAVDVWNFLLEHQKNIDKQLAYWILRTDKNYVNRIVAIAILSNFMDSDLTWWMLAHNLRYPHAAVSNAALAVINSTLKTNPRPVNWEPAFQTLQYLMQGTNLFAYNTVLEMLPKTGASKELATKLLSDGASRLLQDYLQSEFKKVRDYAQTYLSAIVNNNNKENNDWVRTLQKINRAQN